MLCEICSCMCAKRKSIKNPKITTQHTAHSTAHSAQRTAHSAQRTAHSAQRTAHSAQRTAHSAQRTAHSAQRTAHSAQRTAHSAQRTAHSAQRTQRYTTAASMPETGSGSSSSSLHNSRKLNNSTSALSMCMHIPRFGNLATLSHFGNLCLIELLQRIDRAELFIGIKRFEALPQRQRNTRVCEHTLRLRHKFLH
jgi:hypothetical protein